MHLPFADTGLVLSFFVAMLFPQGTTIPSILPARVESLMQGDSIAFFLDVRTAEEFVGNLGHVPGSILIPVQELETRLDELAAHRAKTIIIICRSGVRSGRATVLLRAHGYEAFNMVGGMLRWNAEGRPVADGETR